MAPMNGRSWPKAAVALKPSRMTARGHLRTIGTAILSVRIWAYSRENHGESGRTIFRRLIEGVIGDQLETATLSVSESQIFLWEFRYLLMFTSVYRFWTKQLPK